MWAIGRRLQRRELMATDERRMLEEQVKRLRQEREQVDKLVSVRQSKDRKQAEDRQQTEGSSVEE